LPRGRRRESKKASPEKWKKKNWYIIQAPKFLGNKTIGITPADGGVDTIRDRVYETTLYDLTSDFNHTHIILKFKFKELEEGTNTIKTLFIGCDFTRDYLRSLVRRTTSRIDGIFNLTTKDGFVIRITAIVFTQRRAKTNQQKIIRKIMRDIIEGSATSLDFSEFSYNAVYGNIAKEITDESNKIYPVRRSEIMKIKLVKLPKELSAAA